MANDFTPYATGRTLFGGVAKPSFVSDSLEIERLQSYELYEQIYWNAPEIFKLSMRGTNNLPIYVPAGRTIVDTSNRYTANNFALNIQSSTGNSASNDVVAARLALSDLFKRERFRAKFLGAKRYCQIQGDWVWHVTADPLKPVGTRLTLTTLDPSMYFPIRDPDNLEKITGVILAELTQEGNDPAIRRLLYQKSVTASSTTITVQEDIMKVDEWQRVDAVPVRVIRAATALPPDITSIPVYHTKNFEEPGNPFGSSELRGLETVMSAINQTMSDEELALALEGIGQYVTDAPHPINPQTKVAVPWQLGPGSVNHIPPGHKFDRVGGVGSVSPYGDHYNRLWNAAKWASASPDIAVGTVDVQIAESGIALALQMSPILAKAAEKDELITGTHNQMFFDILTMWYPAYEQTVFADVTIECLVGEKLPIDRAARFAELNDMLDRKVIDTEFYRSEAAKLGYVFPQDINTRVLSEQTALAPTDPFRERLTKETTNVPAGP
jgi:hypothetical protein